MRYFLAIFTFIVFYTRTPFAVAADFNCLALFNLLSNKEVQSAQEAWVDYEELKKLREGYVGSLTFPELKIEIQHKVERLNAERGYLPGLSPDWNATSAKELIDDYLRSSEASKLGNVVRNLLVNDGIMEFYRHRPNSRSQYILEGFSDWKESALETALFLKLQQKLSERDLTHQQFYF